MAMRQHHREIDAERVAVAQERGDGKRVVADGQRILFSDERQITAEFQEKIAEVRQNGTLQLLLRVLLCQTEKLEYVVVFERQQIARFGVFRQTFFGMLADRNVAGEQFRIDLPAQFADGPAFCDSHFQVEVSLCRRVASSDDLAMVGP